MANPRALFWTGLATTSRAKLLSLAPTAPVRNGEGVMEFIIRQGEGGEQGDPLMPLLFSLGAKRALEEAAADLAQGESLFAFLDDAYGLC